MYCYIISHELTMHRRRLCNDNMGIEKRNSFLNNSKQQQDTCIISVDLLSLVNDIECSAARVHNMTYFIFCINDTRVRSACEVGQHYLSKIMLMPLKFFRIYLFIFIIYSFNSIFKIVLFMHLEVRAN